MGRGGRRARACSLALALAFATSACASAADPPAAATSPVPSSPAPAPLLLSPVGLVADGAGTVWAAWAGSGRVSSLDTAGAPGAAVQVGEVPLRLAEVGGALWVTVFNEGVVAEVDPVAGTLLRTVDVGPEPEGIAVQDGHLFVVAQESAELVEVDPVAGAVVARYPVGGAPRQVASDGTALFVTDNEGGVVVRVVPGDPSATTRSAEVCAAAQSVLVLDGLVRASCADAVVALDPASLAEEGRVPLTGSPDGLAAGPDGALLVTLQDGPALVSVPPDGSPQTLETWSSGALADRANVGIVVVDGTAYVSDPLADVVHVVQL